MNSQEVLRGICVALALAVNGIGRAATVYVNGACGDDAWTGASPVCAAPDGPKASIKAALNVMAPGDEAVIAGGVYTGPDNRGLGIGGDKIIRSANGPESCIVDCQGAGQGLTDRTFDSGWSALEARGRRSGGGGGVV